jgi:Aldehyde dehydrogenase family
MSTAVLKIQDAVFRAGVCHHPEGRCAVPVWQLYWRQMGRSDSSQVFCRPQPDQRHRCLSLGPWNQGGTGLDEPHHLYPAGSAFGGYKRSGFGRETNKMMLDHYQQTKNLLVSYSPKALGLL